MSEEKKDLYYVIGDPVEHSLSPIMQNAAFNKLGINAHYEQYLVKPGELEKFLLKDVFEKGVSGFNITIPHKVKAREILERVFPLNNNSSLQLDASFYVKLTEAVNTVKREREQLLYWNTDATGFLRVLNEKLNFIEKNNISALLFGCGGAARSIIAALGWKNSAVKKIYVYEEIAETVKNASDFFFSKSIHAKTLNEKLKFIAKNEIESIIKECALLINATPVGMKDANDSIVDRELLPKTGLSVFDIVYNKNQETRLVRDAKSIGLPVADGLDMLLYQGADAFELWTGEKAPIEVMRNALIEGAKRI
ncbi:MAG: shikimate dehydrogenase [Candidatus Omnitrophica bacterium]|nr:shikimate dehydrogenase [Candidatus Omnitrophota bacterium]